MATVALSAVGSYFGPVGSFIGGVIGGMIDQALFGPGDQEGPRLTDLRVTSSTYGAPIPLPYGTNNRIGGNIIWSTDLVEQAEESGGGKGGGPSVTTYTYSVSLAVALSAREINALKRIWANGILIYDADGVNQFSPPAPLPAVDPVSGQVVTRTYVDSSVSPPENRDRGTHVVFDELHFYPGNATQAADPLIESHEGVGNVPGYRNTSYVVLKDLQLADFGNRIPNLEFELEADASITSGGVAQDIFNRAGISPVSVIGLNDIVQGYVISRQSPVFSALLPIEIGYNFEVSEQFGQLRCVERARAPKGTIPIDNMGATADEIRTPNPVTYTNVTEVQMPDEVSITFSDPALDFQPNTQKAFRREGNAVNKITKELPLVLSADRARQIADRALWGAWSAKTGAKFRVSDTWVRPQPGDIMCIPVAGEYPAFKITRSNRGFDGVIEIDTSRDDPEIYTSQAQGTAGSIRTQSIQIPGDTTLINLDAPLLRDTDPASGFYWAVTAASDGWRGATIKRSSDGGSTYGIVSDVVLRSPIGNVTGVVPSGPTVTWDRSTTITVTLTHSSNTLESVDELLVLNGNNAAWIGPSGGGEGEVVQFATATLVAPLTYELTDLLRGRLGTEHAVGSHGANEVFVLLKSGRLGGSDFGTNDWDKERLYKPVSFLNDELITDAQSFTNTGVRAKPLSPVHVAGSRDGSNNLTVTWLRRSRLRQPGLGGGTLPLGETTEAYEVDVLSGATVVRTISVTSETASYSTAQQTADGFTPGDLISVKIYQLSETRGRGYAAEATI